jgi:N-acyl-L-homoserine lactone synthetase
VNDPNAIVHLDGARLARQRARVLEAWRAAGRARTPHFSACTYFALGRGAEERLRTHVWESTRAYGDDEARAASERAVTFSPAALRSVVAAARDAGVDELFLVPTTADPDELRRAQEALGL